MEVMATREGYGKGLEEIRKDTRVIEIDEDL